MAQHYDYLKRNGIPLKAVAVKLCVVDSNSQVASTVTDNFGLYKFNNIPAGTYDIRFYGNGLTTANWLYNIEVIEAGAGSERTTQLIIKDLLSQYRWADSLFVEDFTDNNNITSALYPDGTSIVFSDGFKWSGTTGGVGTAVVNITNTITDELIPYNTSSARAPVVYKGNRGANTVINSGIYYGTNSSTYIARISQAGVYGTAKCDILVGDGGIVSENNVIYQNTEIPMGSGLSVVFTDIAAPFYLHDSWALRGVSPHINKVAVASEFSGNALIDEVRIIFSGITDRSADLDSLTNTLVISGTQFGVTKQYLTDWATADRGNKFHMQLRLSRTDVSQEIDLDGIFVLFGDSEEYDYWSIDDV